MQTKLLEQACDHAMHHPCYTRGNPYQALMYQDAGLTIFILEGQSWIPLSTGGIIGTVRLAGSYSRIWACASWSIVARTSPSLYLCSRDG